VLKDIADALQKPRKLTLRLDRAIEEFPGTEIFKLRPVLGQAILCVLNKIRSNYCFDPTAADLRSVVLHKRFAGEIHESAVAIGFLLDALDKFRTKGMKSESVSIFDVCSGKGYFSMISAYLFASKVAGFQGFDLKKISLIDLRWAPVWTEAISKSRKNYIKQDHLAVVSRETGIELDPVRIDIHDKQTLKILDESLFNSVLVGVHLCKGLSLRLVELWNKSTTAQALILCPCCLPAKRSPWSKVALGRNELLLKELYQSETPYACWVHFVLSCVDANVKRVVEAPISRSFAHGPIVKGLGRRNMFIIAFK